MVGRFWLVGPWALCPRPLLSQFWTGRAGHGRGGEFRVKLNSPGSSLWIKPKLFLGLLSALVASAREFMRFAWDSPGRVERAAPRRCWVAQMACNWVASSQFRWLALLSGVHGVITRWRAPRQFSFCVPRWTLGKFPTHVCALCWCEGSPLAGPGLAFLQSLLDVICGMLFKRVLTYRGFSSTLAGVADWAFAQVW